MLRFGGGKRFGRIGNGTPSWAVNGALLDMQFTTGLYYASGANVSQNSISCIRAGAVVYTLDNSGTPVGPFGNNVLRIANSGISAWAAQTNRFLNSNAPVTQTITTVNGTNYYITWWGPGSLTLTGAINAVLTNGQSISAAAVGIALLCTVSGATGPNFGNVVSGQIFGEPPIITAGAALASAADQITMDMTQFPWWPLRQYTILFRFMSTASDNTTGTMYQIDDGTNNNRLTANYIDLTGTGQTGLTIQANAGTAHGFDPALPWVIAPNRTQVFGATFNNDNLLVDVCLADAVQGTSPIASFSNTAGVPLNLSTFRFLGRIAGSTPENGTGQELVILPGYSPGTLAAECTNMLARP